MSLSPQQFPRLYHGSVHALEGDTLLPAHKDGATSPTQDPHGWAGQSRYEHVSATDSEDKAWEFAGLASRQRVGLLPRERVHEVEPNADTKIGVEHVDHPVLRKAYDEDQWNKPQPAGEHVSPAFKVKQTHDIKPGNQGTFPDLNWNKFSKDQFGANHPYDWQIERGAANGSYRHDPDKDWKTHKMAQYHAEDMTRANEEGQGKLFDMEPRALTHQDRRNPLAKPWDEKLAKQHARDQKIAEAKARRAERE